MSTILAIHLVSLEPTRYEQRTWRVPCLTLGALFGIGGGLLAALLQAGLWLCAWWWNNAGLDHVSTLLAYLVIPLLLTGASCLDALETTKPQRNQTDIDDA